DWGGSILSRRSVTVGGGTRFVHSFITGETVVGGTLSVVAIGRDGKKMYANDALNNGDESLKLTQLKPMQWTPTGQILYSSGATNVLIVAEPVTSRETRRITINEDMPDESIRPAEALSNGNCLVIANQAEGKIVEVGSAGRTVWSIKIPCA